MKYETMAQLIAGETSANRDPRDYCLLDGVEIEILSCDGASDTEDVRFMKAIAAISGDGNWDSYLSSEHAESPLASNLYERLALTANTVNAPSLCLDAGDRMTNAWHTLVLAKRISEGPLSSEPPEYRCSIRSLENAVTMLVSEEASQTDLGIALKRFCVKAFSLGNISRLPFYRENENDSDTIGQRKGGVGRKLLDDGYYINDQFALFISWLYYHYRPSHTYDYNTWLEVMELAEVENRYLRAASLYKSLAAEVDQGKRVSMFVEYLDQISECIDVRSGRIICRLSPNLQETL